MNTSSFAGLLAAFVLLSLPAPARAGSAFRHVQSEYVHGNQPGADGSMPAELVSTVFVLPPAPAGTVAVRAYPSLLSHRWYGVENLMPFGLSAYDGTEYANWALSDLQGHQLWGCSETVGMCGGAPLAPAGEEGSAHDRSLESNTPVWALGQNYQLALPLSMFQGDRRARALRLIGIQFDGLSGAIAPGPIELGPECLSISSYARLAIDLVVEYSDDGVFHGPPPEAPSS